MYIKDSFKDSFYNEIIIRSLKKKKKAINYSNKWFKDVVDGVFNSLKCQIVRPLQNYSAAQIYNISMIHKLNDTTL